MRTEDSKQETLGVLERAIREAGSRTNRDRRFLWLVTAQEDAIEVRIEARGDYARIYPDGRISVLPGPLGLDGGRPYVEAFLPELRRICARVLRKPYPAIIHHDEGTAFGVSFPDFPGVIASGDTIDAAIMDAEGALAASVALMVEHGQAIPSPSTREHIATLDGAKDAHSIVFVRAVTT